MEKAAIFDLYGLDNGKSILNKINKAKSILDKDFCAHFLQERSSRLLELDVADQLLSCGDIQVSNGSPKKDMGGPDFKFKCENYNVFIECVCAQDSDGYVYKECEIYPIEGYKDNIYSQIGEDKRKVAIIYSSISSKCEKIQKYRSQGIISDNDIVVLVVGVNFEKKSKFFSDEFESTIKYKDIIDNDGFVTLEQDNDRRFTKRICKNKDINEECEDKEIKIEERVFDSFNIFICADTFASEIRKPDQFFSYTPYVRKLPDESSKEIIEKIFHANAIEFNRFLYRSDGHERCSEKAILEAYKSQSR